MKISLILVLPLTLVAALPELEDWTPRPSPTVVSPFDNQGTEAENAFCPPYPTPIGVRRGRIIWGYVGLSLLLPLVSPLLLILKSR